MVLDPRIFQADPELAVCAPDSGEPVELLAAVQGGADLLHPWPATPGMLSTALRKMDYAEREQQTIYLQIKEEILKQEVKTVIFSNWLTA